MAKKMRADQLVFEQGLAESREQAKRLIMAGQVVIDPQRELPEGVKPAPVQKAGQNYPVDTVFMLLGKERFVSRGGYKLLTAIEHFHLDVTDYICLDAGASTGGFTDCLLQFGAKKVYAVDVGHAQLHEKMQQHPQVVNMEGINLRYADETLLPEKVDIMVSDVSFISLTLIIPPCMKSVKKGGLIVCLIKPQFEAGREKVGKKGVVRDASVHEEVIHTVVTFAAEQGFCVKNLEYSPIKGPEGNIEYLVHLKKEEQGGREDAVDIHAVVAAAHKELDH